MKKIVSIVMLIGILFCCSFMQAIAEPSHTSEKEFVQYLKNHWQSPEEYISGKFDKYDIVFVGEFHRLKHDPELIQNLIPYLYKNGVYNLGIEMSGYEFQNEIDKLVTANEYDEASLINIMIKSHELFIGYRENMDIYKKVWEFNKSLSKDNPKFRIVNLDFKQRGEFMQENMTPELYKKLMFKGDRDSGMASIIIKEFINKNKKVLIYCGYYHACTRFYPPGDKGLDENKLGSIIYRRMPDKVFNIYLHSPLRNKYAAGTMLVYPFNGAIDKVMKNFKNKRVGFDVVETPFTLLNDNRSVLSEMYGNINLGDFCDGYVYQKPIKEYEGVTVDPKCFPDDRYDELINIVWNYDQRKYYKTSKDIYNGWVSEVNDEVVRRIREMEDM